MAGKTYRFRVRHSGQYLVPSGHTLDAGTMLKQYYASLYLTEEYLLDFAEYTNNTFWHYLKPMNHVEVCVDTGSVQSDGYIHPVLQNAGTQDSMKFQLVPVGTGYALISKTGYILGVKLADYANAADIVAENAPANLSTSTVGEHQILVLEEVSKYVSSGVSYTSDGRNIASTRDARMKYTYFTYDSNNRLLSYVTDPNGHSIHYSYDPDTDQVTEVSAAVGNSSRSVAYTYDSADRLKTIDHNGTLYTYDYDGFGNLLSVKVGTTQAGTVTLESYEYFSGNGPIKKVTYGNGAVEEYLYDNEERLIGRKWNNTQTVSYTYDADGNLETETDLENDLTYRIRYDSTGRLVRVCEVDGTRRQTLTYDRLLRKTQEAIHLPGNDTRYHTYEYGTDINAVRTDMLLTYMTNDTDSYGYTYDNAGNISSITVNGTQVISYVYDELNQLIRENNAVLNKTITYTYDLGGNMTSRKEYAYTTGTLGTPTKTDTFTYGNTDWKDQLTAYNGVGITYDGSGNPLSYRGMTMTWQKGRQLASVVKNGVTTSFTYDSGGRRIRKTSGTNANDQTVTRYYYNGESLTGLVKGNQIVQFVYDAEGRPFLMRVYTANNGTPSDYYYLYNGQGDVTGLIDSSNSTVVHYTYDSWGKMVSVTDTTSASISTLNPFRYRGYIYDPETGLYYVSSRYYDPEICRWINADGTSYLGASGDFISYNLFAYCGNNPVTGYDPDGTLDWGNLFKGSGWLAVGVTAIAVGVSVLTCGVAAPAMMAVAAVTVAAGAATAVNGVSELGEAVTGHNFMRDDVFRGNVKAYNTYAHTTAAVAEIGTMVCGGWLKTNSPRIKAYKSMDTYNVKGKHLSSGNGNWSKFNTTSQAELRTLGKKAIKNSPMGSLYPNSADSYRLIYDYGRVIGTSGETSARLIFSNAGKIITFFPQ